MYDVEYTDTDNGAPNYSWARRYVIAAPAWDTFKDWDGNGRREPRAYQRTVMRRAKAAAGLENVRGVTDTVGDGYEFRPYGSATVMFVTWRDRELGE